MHVFGHFFCMRDFTVRAPPFCGISKYLPSKSLSDLFVNLIFLFI